MHVLKYSLNMKNLEGVKYFSIKFQMNKFLCLMLERRNEKLIETQKENSYFFFDSLFVNLPISSPPQDNFHFLSFHINANEEFEDIYI